MNFEVFGVCRGIYWMERKMLVLGKGFDNILYDLILVGEWIFYFLLLCLDLIEWFYLKVIVVFLWVVVGVFVWFRVFKNIVERLGDYIENKKFELFY